MAPTPPTTPNHDLPLIPHVGDDAAQEYSDDWGAILNDSAWSVLEEQLIVRDVENNRTSYTPHQDALFFATDTGAIYVGDGSTWTQSASDVTNLTVSGDVDIGGSLSASNDSVSVAGNTVSLGGSTAVAHSDLSSVSTDDHHAYPVPNSGLTNDTVTVAGNSISLGGSTTIAHGDLTSTSSSDHHAYPVPNSGLVNDTVTVAGNAVGLGGTTAISHSDLSSTSRSDHHAYPVPNSGLANDSVTVAGNSVSLGDSTSIAHGDLSSVGANNHHTAHEHPGDKPATATIDANSNSITGITDLTGQYATHSFTGSTYNIDLRDSSVDARFRNTAANTIAWFRENGNVEVPNGQLFEQGNRVATRTWVDNEISAGATSLSGLDTAVSNLQSNKLDSSAYTPESDTHSKTTSASALTDVSADSVSNAHHSRYADSEAVSAIESVSSVSLQGDLSVEGRLTTGEPLTHPTTIEDEFTIPSSSGVVLAGQISGTGNISGEGSVTIIEPDSSPIKTGSDVVTVVNNDKDHGSTASHNYFSGSHTNLTDVGSDDHHERYTDTEASDAAPVQSVNGETGNISISGFSGSHNDLTNVGSSDHHARYTDAEAVGAINAETSLSVDISGNADSVGGYTVQKDGSSEQGIINFVTGGQENLSVESIEPFSSHLTSTQTDAEDGLHVNIFGSIDKATPNVSVNSASEIVFDSAGTYEISWMVNFHRTGSGSRNIMYSEIERNGQKLSDISRVADYIRTDGSGDECSTGSSVVLELSAGDTLRIYANEERGGESGNDIERAFINIIPIF